MREIKTLKLNVSNIKSTLINSNKELKKLRSDEKTFIRNQQTRSKRIRKESFVEGKIPGSGMVGGALSKMAAPAMSIIDKIKEFAGTILLGILINNLPTLIRKVDQFLEDNKGIIDAFKFIGNTMIGFIDVFKKKDYTKELKKDNEELLKLKKEFSKGSDFDKELDGLDKDTIGLEKEFSEEFKEQYTARTPEQVRDDVVTTLSGGGTLKNLDFKLRTFNMLQNAVKNKNLSSVGYKANTGDVYTVPGIGSYTIETTKFIGIPVGDPYLVTRDVYGQEIPTEQFSERVSAVSGLENLKGISKSLKESGVDDSVVEGYSEGGPVSPSISPQTGRGSAEGKIATRQFSYFLDFKEQTLKAANTLNIKEKIENQMDKIIEDLKEYLNLTKEKYVMSPTTLPTNDPKQQGPVLPSVSGLVRGTPTGPGDPASDGEQTGLDMALPGGEGVPIKAPIDLIYREKGTDGLPAVGLQGNATPLHKQLGGRGFGYYGAYYYTGPDGNEDEVLMGHFRDMPYKGAKDGDKIPAGTLLGYQGASGASDPMDGTLNPWPHISLHVNRVRGGTASINELLRFQGLLINQNTSTSSAPKITPKSKGANGANGGIRRHDLLTQYYDGEGMTKIVIINSTQPIYIPT